MNARPYKVTVEASGRSRRFRLTPLYSGPDNSVSAVVYRANVAGCKGSMGVAWPRVWVERYSALGQRLHGDPMARERIMALLPAGNSYEWNWF